MTNGEPIEQRIRRDDNRWLAWALARYRVSPDHKGKLRLWNWLHYLARRPDVVVRYAGAARLRLDLKDLVQVDIAKHGYYEIEVWDALAAFVTGDDVLWDVGGHVGSVAIRAALNPGVRCVYTFEPNPRTAARLLANLELNPKIQVHHQPIALSDRQEIRSLHFGDAGNIGLASVVLRPTAESVPVECTTADAWIAAGKASPPTLMKIDVEGFERDVLAGAEKLLASGVLKAIVFEAEVDEAGRLLSDAITDLLRAHGYSIRHVPRPEGFRTSRENYLAARSANPHGETIAPKQAGE
jgi:FkbM family methyltransferase